MLLFHGNNGFVNAPRCYVIRALPVWFSLSFLKLRFYVLRSSAFYFVAVSSHLRSLAVEPFKFLQHASHILYNSCHYQTQFCYDVSVRTKQPQTKLYACNERRSTAVIVLAKYSGIPLFDSLAIVNKDLCGLSSDSPCILC